MRMTIEPTPFVLGWEEWVGLPDLGLPAIKAKIDTGARTSALHAFLIEPFGPSHAPHVRFGIHPIAGRHDIEIYCSAPILDRREVTSSNGERELRFVIQSMLSIGGRSWPIELTLTNRETMSYRMLIGRQAIRADVFVDPSASFLQPRLSYKLYRHLPPRDVVHRALRLAVITAMPAAASNRRLLSAAEARGHVLEIVDLRRLHFAFAQPTPQMLLDGQPFAHYDAVIPRLAPRDGPISLAAIRHLELMGTMALNSSEALTRAADPLAVLQVLAHHAIRVAPPTIDADTGRCGWSRAKLRPRFRLLQIGDATFAAVALRRDASADAGERALTVERDLAARAVRALKLRLASVDVGYRGDVAVVARVSAAPALGTFEKATGARIAEAVVLEAEGRVRSWVRRAATAAAQAADVSEAGC